MPTYVPKRVPHEQCREVPAVDCFFVLKTVPDVLCGPQPYQDCQDVVKEVPYLSPEERCEKVPHENCEEVEEQVPVEVCTSVDLTREPIISKPGYGRLRSRSGPRTRRGRSLAVGDSGASSNEKREEEVDANARLLRAVYLGEEDQEETFLIKERWRKENPVIYR